MQRLDEEITKYLACHPQASDTIEGIAEWWIPKNVADIVTQELRQSLERLVSCGKVKAIQGASGEVRYSLGQTTNSTTR